MIFNDDDFYGLSVLFEGVTQWHLDGLPRVPYAGYRPEVREAPNGDTKACPECASYDALDCPCCNGSDCSACHGTGRVPNVDAEKRFLHVAPKYLDKHPGLEWPRQYLARAHYEACRVAEALRVPDAYYPRAENGTLRVIDYPAGAGSAEHTDFDLFTILCWRSTPEDLEREQIETLGRVESLSPGLHIGEIGELVGLGPATPHRVPARPYAQKSIVYFAIPDHAALLPNLVQLPDNGAIPRPTRNQTVGEWLAERMARSRVGARSTTAKLARELIYVLGNEAERDGMNPGDGFEPFERDPDHRLAFDRDARNPNY